MPEIDPQLQFAPAAPLPHPTVKQAEEAGAIGGGCTIGSLLRRDIPLAIVTSSQVPYRDLLQSLELGYAMTMQVISVVGALMVLFAYGLIQAGTWRELDAGYLALNIVGNRRFRGSAGGVRAAGIRMGRDCDGRSRPSGSCQTRPLAK